MKYIKLIFVVLCVSFFMISCDDDDKRIINSTNAIVEFEESTVSIKETVTFLTVPIVVSGDERDGDIFIHATMKDNNASFELDKDVIITTETFRIPAHINSVNFEIGLHIENEELVKGRNITLSIEKIEGASVGQKSSCLLSIIEKTFLEGVYTIKGINPFDDLFSTGRCTLMSEDESIENMKFDFNIGGAARAKFTEVEKNKIYDVEILPFQFVGTSGGYNAYFSWAKYEESTGNLLYDREKPILGRFERKTENGEESMIITFEDDFGFVAELNGELSWFYNVWIGEVTMEKNK